MKIYLPIFLLLITLFTSNGQTSSGYALEFDGIDDYVEIDSNLTFAEMTVEAWIYTDNWSIDTDSSVILGNFGTDGWRISLADSLEINIIDGDTQKNLKWDDDGLSGWNHITFTISASDNLRLYVNGQEVANDLTISTSLESDTSINTILGAQVDTSAGQGADTLFFNGKLDEVRFWSDVRTQEEININMYKEISDTLENLEAYYQMSDGSGLTLTDNEEQGLNTGTLNNMDDSGWVTSTIFLSSNNAIEFDGIDDSIFINNDFDTTNFTIEFWFTKTGTNNWPSVFTNKNSSGGFQISVIADVPRVVNIEFEGGNNVSFEANTGWNHLAMTKSPTEIQFYLNGILETTKTDGYTASTSDTSILGGLYGAAVFEGQIDEFRVWSTVRTASQIREYLCQTVDPSAANLMAYYNFNHEDLGIVYDQTGNGNNGTLINMDNEAAWVSSTAYNTWLGGSSSNWNDGDNWSLGTAPTSTHSLGFYSYNEGNSPIINDSRTVRNVIVGSSATVGSTSDFSVNENLLLQGSLTFATDNDICTIGNDWVIESTGSASLEDSAKVTIEGDTHNDGTILLKSPTDMGATASLITTGTLTNNGTMQMERFVTFGTEGADNYNWHMMTPVIGSFAAQTYFDGDYVYSFDESADTDGGASAWININTDSIMSPGTGYIVKTLNSDKTYTYSGTFIDGDISLELARTDDTDDQGFNLVGNPYPSAIDWDASNGWSKTSIGNDIWIWNPADTLYAVWDGTTSTNDGSQYIHPGQAFFVQVSTGETAGNLSMNDSVRVHNTGGVYFKSTENHLDLIKLALWDGNNKDEWAAYISDKPNTTTKFFSWNPGKSQIYSYISDTEKPLAIQKIAASDTMEIPLGIKAVHHKPLRFSILKNTFNSNKFNLYLKDGDILTPIDDINSKGYHFKHDSLSEKNRFSLLAINKNLTNIAKEKPELPDHIKIKVYQGYLEITDNLLGNKSVKVYDVSGREIHRRNFIDQTNLLELPGNGVYFVQINDKTGNFVRKFVY